MTTDNKHIGADFDDFIKEDGILETVTATTLLKRMH